MRTASPTSRPRRKRRRRCGRSPAIHVCVFAAGIIGTGVLAVPVLAGSAAYALGEALGWPTGLARLPLDAKAFYGAIAGGR